MAAALVLGGALSWKLKGILGRRECESLIDELAIAADLIDAKCVILDCMDAAPGCTPLDRIIVAERFIAAFRRTPVLLLVVPNPDLVSGQSSIAEILCARGYLAEVVGSVHAAIVRAKSLNLWSLEISGG